MDNLTRGKLTFWHQGKDYRIETEPFLVTVTCFVAVAVDDQGNRTSIPGCSSHSPHIAEGLALLTVAMLPGVEI